MWMKAQDAQKYISQAKNRNLTPAQCHTHTENRLIQFARRRAATLHHCFAREAADIFELYQAELRYNNALDFDDLLLCTNQLLQQHPDIVASIEQVLVDEFQARSRPNRQG